MTKVFCGHRDCKNNKENICQSKTVELTEDYSDSWLLKCLDYHGTNK